MMATALDWANYYHHKMGWNVIPVYRKQKKVAIEWEEYQRHRTDPKHFEEWFVEKGYNVALMLGPTSGISVLDIDSKEAWEMFWPIVGNLNTPIVKSPGGEHRHHVYFKHRAEIGNLAVKPWYEYRSTNCIIVAPPSLGLDGRIYAWVVRPVK